PQAPDNGPWRLSDGVEITPDVRLRLSSLMMIRDAVRAGAGIALLPRSVIAADAAAGRLDVWSGMPQRASELWVLHTSRRLVSTKITAFVSFLFEAFPDGTISPKESAPPSGCSPVARPSALQEKPRATGSRRSHACLSPRPPDLERHAR